MRRLQALFLLIGLAGLAWMLSRVGLGSLKSATALGVGLAGAALIHAIVLALDSCVLVLCTGQPFGARLLARAFRAYLAGHAINLTTALGVGEATKFTLLADDVPREELAAALLVQNTLSFLVTSTLIVVVGLLAPAILPLDEPFPSLLRLAAAIFFVGGVGLPLVIRRGPWRWPFAVAHRLGLSQGKTDRARAFVDKMAIEVGRRVKQRRRAVAAIVCAVLSRCGSAAEIGFLLYHLGVDLHPLVPFLSLVNAQVIHWLTFFIPFQAGSNEAGSYFLFRAIGLEPGLGIVLELAKKTMRVAFLAAGVGVLGWQNFRRLRDSAR
jgi:hypothetical protein